MELWRVVSSGGVRYVSRKAAGRFHAGRPPFFMGLIMGLSDLLTGDIARLINSSGFGATVTYSLPNGVEDDYTAVLFDERTETRETRGINTIYRMRACTFKRSDIANINLRSTVIVSDVEWAIANVIYQDDQLTTVQLERHELHEHTRPGYRRQ